MAGLIGLGREAEGHGPHVPVVGGTGNEGHEQQVGEYVLEAEADRHHELERARGNRIIEEALGHRQEPHPVVGMVEIMHAVVVLVVVGDGVHLGLCMTDLVERLHQASNTRPRARKLAAGVSKAAVRNVLERANAAHEQLDGVDVARIGDVEMAVVLVERVENGVQLALLLGLVFPVGIHGQAERIFPLVPVVDLDALIGHVGIDVFHLLVRRHPVETSGHDRITLFQPQFLLGNLHVHVFVSLSFRRSSRASSRRRSGRGCPTW